MKRYASPFLTVLFAVFSLAAGAQDSGVTPKYGKHNCTASNLEVMFTIVLVSARQGSGAHHVNWEIF